MKSSMLETIADKASSIMKWSENYFYIGHHPQLMGAYEVYQADSRLPDNPKGALLHAGVAGLHAGGGLATNLMVNHAKSYLDNFGWHESVLKEGMSFIFTRHAPSQAANTLAMNRHLEN